VTALFSADTIHAQPHIDGSPSMRPSIFKSILAVVTVHCAAESRGADEPKKVYGSAFLDPYFELGAAVQDAVKLRYKCRVVANECVRPEMWNGGVLHPPRIIQSILLGHRFPTRGSGEMGADPEMEAH
jgi:hypothetical protein